MIARKVNQEFFGKWSSEMAYILGIITTDGCLVEYRNGHHGLDITSKDTGLLKQIKSILHSEHKISKKTRGYRLQIRNKALYADLLRLGLTPRKTKTKIFPNVPKEYLSDFIRGCFDGDGSVFVWKDPRWNHPLQIRSTFASGSIEFIKRLRQVLVLRAGLSEGYLQCRKEAVELKYAISDSLRLYKFIYNADPDIYLERKKNKFESFIKYKLNTLN